MKRNALYFSGGFVLATLLFVVFIGSNNRKASKKTPYFILNKDYKIGKNAILKKGTKIKFDKGMDEGFSRFILYINIKGADIRKETYEQSNMIIPYWLYEVGTEDTVK